MKHKIRISLLKVCIYGYLLLSSFQNAQTQNLRDLPNYKEDRNTWWKYIQESVDWKNSETLDPDLLIELLTNPVYWERPHPRDGENRAAQFSLAATLRSPIGSLIGKEVDSIQILESSSYRNGIADLIRGSMPSRNRVIDHDIEATDELDRTIDPAERTARLGDTNNGIPRELAAQNRDSLSYFSFFFFTIVVIIAGVLNWLQKRRRL